MYFILGLIAIALAAGKLFSLWDLRASREEEKAELEAAARHTCPVLIRSRYIGDPTVEEAYHYLCENIRRSRNPWIKPENVHMEVYTTRTNTGNMYISFQNWVDMVEAEHRQRVLAWETANLTTMKTDGRDIGVTDEGRRAFTGQRAPKKRSYVFDLNH